MADTKSITLLGGHGLCACERSIRSQDAVYHSITMEASDTERMHVAVAEDTKLRIEVELGSTSRRKDTTVTPLLQAARRTDDDVTNRVVQQQRGNATKRQICCDSVYLCVFLFAPVNGNAASAFSYEPLDFMTNKLVSLKRCV